MNSEKKSEAIKNTIVKHCTPVKSGDVEIIQAPESYYGSKDKYGFTNRNAGAGELVNWVLIEIPTRKRMKSDVYYQSNPHVRKPDKASIEETNNMIEMIESACRQAANSHNAEYIGYNSESRGFDSSNPSTRYLNICVK